MALKRYHGFCLTGEWDFPHPAALACFSGLSGVLVVAGLPKLARSLVPPLFIPCGGCEAAITAPELFFFLRGSPISGCARVGLPPISSPTWLPPVSKCKVANPGGCRYGCRTPSYCCFCAPVSGPNWVQSGVLVGTLWAACWLGRPRFRCPRLLTQLMRSVIPVLRNFPAS